MRLILQPLATLLPTGVALLLTLPLAPSSAAPRRAASTPATSSYPSQNQSAQRPSDRRWRWSQRPNRTKAGGSLSAGCKDPSKILTALVPQTNPVSTTSAHPTIWIYSPYHSDEVKAAEFYISTGPNEAQRVYRTAIALPKTPGFVGITLPAQSQSALQVGTPYRWYFTLVCGGAQLSVDAGIERVAAGTAAPAWYDSLAQAAQRVQANPQDAQARDRWRQILREMQLDAFANQPLVQGVAQPIAPR